jgi:4-amino-4-deoxy-L-arabinose transferase-like glycosyltransferase
MRAGLALLTGLALGLRLYALDDKSLWGDEMNMVRFSTGERPMELSFGNAPLYVALLRAVSVIGTTDFAYRLPAALFGTAIVPVLFLLGRRVADWRVGAVASLLAALSPTLIEHAQSVHSYSAFCLLSLLGHHLFARAWERDSKVDWTCLVLTVGAGLYVHLYMVFVVANLVALSAVWAARDGAGFRWGALRAGYRRRRRSLLTVVLAIGVIWSPWLARWIGPLLWDLGRRSLGLEPRVDYLAQDPRLRVGWRLGWRALQDLLTGDLQHTGFAVAGLALAIVGAVALWRWRPQHGVGLVAWIVLPLGPTALFTYLSRIDYGTRRLIFLLPELLLLVAVGLLALAGALVAAVAPGLRVSRRGRQLGALLLAAGAAAAASGPLLSAYFERENADYRRLAVFLEGQVRHHDAVVVWKPERFGYYYDGSHEILDVESLTMEEVKTLHATSRRFWYVRPRAVRMREKASFPELEAWLEAEGIFTFSFGGGLDVSFDRRADAITPRGLRERVRLLEDALQLKPDRWYLHQALARTYRGWQGKESEARYHAERAAQLRP